MGFVVLTSYSQNKSIPDSINITDGKGLKQDKSSTKRTDWQESNFFV